MKWPYTRRIDSVAAWGIVAVGTAGLVAIPVILATLHAADSHFRWWWPTDWMAVPLVIFVIGVALAAVPILRAGEPAGSPDQARNGEIPADAAGHDDPQAPGQTARPPAAALTPEPGGVLTAPPLRAVAATVKHAFICYARSDSGHARRLRQILQGAGIQVWMDTADLWPGQDWRTQIRHAITSNALVFVACFSRASLARTSGHQYEELTLAIEQLRQRRPGVVWLIPVRFDDCQIPDWDIGGGRTLASLHHADLFGDHYQDNAGQLVQVICKLLGRQDTPSQRSEPVLPDQPPASTSTRQAHQFPAVLTHRVLPVSNGLQDGTMLVIEVRAVQELTHATVIMTGMTGPPGATMIPPPARLYWHPAREPSAAIAEGASGFINIARTGPIPPGAVIDTPDQDLPWTLADGLWQLDLQLTAAGHPVLIMTATFDASPARGFPVQRLDWLALSVPGQLQ